MRPKAVRTAADGISRWSSVAERKEVNEALDVNATWRTVAAICARHGRPGVSSVNVSNYRASSDRKEWLARRERMDAIRRESDVTAEIVATYVENGGSPAEAGLLRAAEILTLALGGLDPAVMREELAKDPKKIFSFVQSFKSVTDMLGKKRADAVPDAAGKPDAVDPQEAIKLIFGL